MPATPITVAPPDPVPPRHPPYDWAHQQQVQEEDQGPVPTQVPVDERQRQLYEHGGQQHEGDGEAQPDVVFGLMVPAAEHGGGDELRQVEYGGQHDAEGRVDVAVIHHQHDPVLHHHRGALLRVQVRDVPLVLLHGHLAHDVICVSSGGVTTSEVAGVSPNRARKTWLLIFTSLVASSLPTFHQVDHRWFHICSRSTTRLHGQTLD